ncbi:hypothetical protein M0R45_029335 [Rubus argutus]|uniref:Uncharacterized protein n=1 Tax=Rubus argutus TaxID=59490 RepID=A0AAW1WBD0_RUBAR
MNLGTLTCTNPRFRCGDVETLPSATRYFQRGGKWGRGLLSWTKSKAGLAFASQKSWRSGFDTCRCLVRTGRAGVVFEDQN